MHQGAMKLRKAATLSLTREVLAQRVIDKVNGIAVKLVELEDDIRTLWREFDNLKAGETIAGCATKRNFASASCTGRPARFDTCLLAVIQTSAKGK